jgi:uncharacterized protein YneF (UPF0154 family)
MSEFWQYFAVGIVSLLVGIQMGKAIAISQLYMQQKQGGGPQFDPQMLQALMANRTTPGGGPPNHGG